MGEATKMELKKEQKQRMKIVKKKGNIKTEVGQGEKTRREGKGQKLEWNM
jgi:hypothetical protein